jgi:hypothetical protein
MCIWSGIGTLLIPSNSRYDVAVPSSATTACHSKGVMVSLARLLRDTVKLLLVLLLTEEFCRRHPSLNRDSVMENKKFELQARGCFRELFCDDIHIQTRVLVKGQDLKDRHGSILYWDEAKIKHVLRWARNEKRVKATIFIIAILLRNCLNEASYQTRTRNKKPIQLSWPLWLRCKMA